MTVSDPRRYRGRTCTDAEIVEIRERIAADPTLSRRRLSAELCESWNWRQANGHLCDMICRGLLLQLHRAGVITLPPVRCRPKNNIIAHRRSRSDTIMAPGEPIACPLSSLRPITIQQVRRTPQEGMVEELLAGYHFLGYTRPVGEHLKFLISSEERILGCMVWSSPARRLGPRDRFIGWTPAQRQEHIAGIAYNTRFLIAPWVRVPHLASHVLGWMARYLSREWEAVYNHGVYLAETFVDPSRNRGTCYRAANWIHVGQTTGRGKTAKSKKPNRTLKDIWVLPLTRHFRRRLTAP